MSGAVAEKIPFESQRVPLERRITLKFQHRDGFVNEYAANISLKGLFITSWVPEPPGRVFLFEVQVADQQRLIHGVGEVVWVREAEESPDRPSGMGVRFLKLDEESSEVIRGMVEEHVRRGGTPFDPADAPAGTVTVEDLFGDRGEGAGVPFGPAENESPRGAEAELATDAEAGAEPAADGQLATVVRDARLTPPAGRAMARRRGRAQLWLWLVLLLLLGGSALAVLLS